MKTYDEELEADSFVQMGGDGDDTITAIAGNSDIMNDVVIVGSTLSEDDHLFGLDSPSKSEQYPTAVKTKKYAPNEHGRSWDVVMNQEKSSRAPCSLRSVAVLDTL